MGNKSQHKVLKVLDQFLLKADPKQDENTPISCMIWTCLNMGAVAPLTDHVLVTYINLIKGHTIKNNNIKHSG